MGLKDLLGKALCQYVDRQVTIDSLCNQGLTRGAVDNSSWWHSSLFTVACGFCENKEAAVILGVCRWYKDRIDMLGRCGVKSLDFVFDGARLPAKEVTKLDREKKAELALAKAVVAKAALGNRPSNQDFNAYKKLCNGAVQRTPGVEAALRDFLANYKGSVRVRFVVALFEADAQLAQLLRAGVVDYVIAEDQDLAMYTPGRFVFKLGYNPKNSRKFNYKKNECDFLDTLRWGDGDQMPTCGLSGCTAASDGKRRCKTCAQAGTGLTREGLLKACVLAGSDYCPGVPNVGLVKSADAIRKHKTMEAAITEFNKKEKTKTDDDFLGEAIKAMHTFKYHYVCHLDAELQVTSVGHLNDPDGRELGDKQDYLGVPPDMETAGAISNGTRNPSSPYLEYDNGGVSDVAMGVAQPILVLPVPTAVERAAYGAENVALDRLLTVDEIDRVLAIRIIDVLHADTFARDPDGNLLTPALQLALFKGIPKPTIKHMDRYLNTRGLATKTKDRDEKRRNVIAAMEKEVRFGFDIRDTDDGRYQTTRLLNLIRIGVLNYDNAPGYCPAECPPLDDPFWRYATYGDVDGINILENMERWRNLFYDSYARTSGHLQKALVKVTCGRAYHLQFHQVDDCLYFSWMIDRSRSS